MVIMNRLDTHGRAQIIRCLAEGNSIRSTVRITGFSKNTVTKLLLDMALVCADYQDKAFRNLACKRLQLDEIWSFCYAKQKNVPTGKQGEFGYGDVWTWTAIDADTKLIPSWFIGRRDAGCATAFIQDLASRLASRVQITTDGLKSYVNAVEDAFGSDVDYAQLVKLYGESKIDSPERKYSPSECTGTRTHITSGDPELGHISTSFVERANLTMRMQMRRFTRLTNGFSKKIQNHAAAVAMYFMYYNFCRVHQTLRVTPAMEAGVSDHVWAVEEMVGLLEAVEPKGKERGPYKKKNSN